jgi:ABC-type molybdenum transport system ATPase subunit/photorepair protein PhrA
MGRNPIKELREKIELLSEELHKEQEKRMLYDIIITIFLTIFIIVSPMIFTHISIWYQSLDEFNKGALIGVVSFIIAFSITRILIGD